MCTGQAGREWWGVVGGGGAARRHKCSSLGKVTLCLERTLRGGQIRNLVALSQMPLFNLRGRGTQDLARLFQAGDKFARKWKRLEP